MGGASTAACPHARRAADNGRLRAGDATGGRTLPHPPSSDPLLPAACIALVLLFSAGCITQRTVPLGARTPAACGNLKLYATDNVPFEYEEIACLAQSFDMFAYGMDDCLRLFAAKAQELGADAILDFHMENGPGVGGVFGVTWSNLGDSTSYLHLTGVAVKIRRP
jgi:hypothetical protein